MMKVNIMYGDKARNPKVKGHEAIGTEIHICLVLLQYPGKTVFKPGVP
jgi:hypothetical protein